MADEEKIRLWSGTEKMFFIASSCYVEECSVSLQFVIWKTVILLLLQPLLMSVIAMNVLNVFVLLSVLGHNIAVHVMHNDQWTKFSTGLDFIQFMNTYGTPLNKENSRRGTLSLVSLSPFASIGSFLKSKLNFPPYHLWSMQTTVIIITGQV